MAIVVKEIVESRKWSEDYSSGISSFERNFIIYGTNEPGVAKDSGPAYGDLIPNGMGLDAYILRVTKREVWPFQFEDGGDLGLGACKLRVLYEWKRIPSQGKVKYTLDINTEQSHIQEAYAQTNYPATATKFEERIGVTDDSIEGTDVYSPISEYTENYESTNFTNADRDEVRNMTGKTNSVAFRGWQIGEVLFVGANVVYQENETWDITYRFLSRQNRNAGYGNQLEFNTTSGGAGVETVDKLGWQYLWVRIKENEDPTSKKNKWDIDSVHVATVYESDDFHDLPEIDAS